MSNLTHSTREVDHVLETYQQQIAKLINTIKENTGNTIPPAINTALLYIKQRIYTPELGISLLKRDNIIRNRRFPALFENTTGLKPTAFINFHRVEASKKLLGYSKFSALTVTNVAYQVGYRRSSTYIKAFKRCEDIPPGRWRDKNETG